MADSRTWKGRMEMVREIRLTPNDVQHFVNVASRCDFDIDISDQRVVIDAKSILGVMGLGMEKRLTVKYGGENLGFEDVLSKYTVA